MSDLAQKEWNRLKPVAVPVRSDVTVDSIEYNPYYQRVIEKVLHVASTVFLNSQRSEASVAVFDNLTGLPNAKSAKLFFESEWNHARCQRHQFTVMVAGLVNLQSLVSQYGKGAIDRLVVETAETLQINLQKYEFLGRTAQEEFVAVLPGDISCDLDDIILGIQDGVEDIIYRRFNKVAGTVSIRIGAAEYGVDGLELEKLYTVARQAARSQDSVCDDAGPAGTVISISDYFNDAPHAS
jgi:diguanylate cyclase (GGDEF)-like protein